MIDGLDSLIRKIKELERAAFDLDGEIAHLTFDPYDPQSIEQAIQDFCAAVDERVAGYSKNELVAGIAEELKENGRRAILERAAVARLEGENQE